MKIKFALFIIFHLLLLQRSYGKPVPPEVKEGQKAVVRIHIEDSQGAKFQGSGFFVKNNTNLTTNFHVVHPLFETLTGKDQNTESKTSFQVDLDRIVVATPEGRQFTLEVKGIALSIRDDLAILKVKGYTGAFLDIADLLPNNKSEVYGLGFPAFNRGNLTIIEGFRTFEKQMQKLLTIISNTRSIHGMSGGPLLNKTGQVIGITASGQDNFVYGSTLSKIKHLLDKNNFTDPASARKMFEEEIENIERSIKQGNVWDQYVLGLIYDRNVKHIQKSTDWLMGAANGGLAIAQTAIANRFYEAFNTAFDNYKKGDTTITMEAIMDFIQTAAYWYQKAANQNWPPAQFKLGSLYAAGIGVPKNERKSLSLFQKAAKRGLHIAQFALFKRFLTGAGVPTNRRKALFWLKEAKKTNIFLAEQEDRDIIAEILAQKRELGRRHNQSPPDLDFQLRCARIF